jgi:LppP/LprE lipoprotein
LNALLVASRLRQGQSPAARRRLLWTRHLLALAVTGLTLSGTVSPAQGAEVDFISLRQKAGRYAEATYVNAHSFGKRHRLHRRHFHLFEQTSYTVKADDGSLFTAFQATLASADGTGDIVLLFDEEDFVGWASNRLAANSAPARRGNVILVRYAIYRHRDAICCPSGFKTISYSWNGSKVLHRGEPPRAFGEVGPQLHMEGVGRAQPKARRAPLRSQPGLHKARLSVGVARSAASAFLGRKYGEAWYSRNGGRLKCGRRRAFNARKCDIGFQIGDSGWFGTLRIALFRRAFDDRRARIQYRIHQIDEYCFFVLHKSVAECTMTSHGIARLNFF